MGNHFFLSTVHVYIYGEVLPKYMEKFGYFRGKFLNLCNCFHRSCQRVSGFLLFHLNPFWVQLSYFLLLSLLGYGFLKVLAPRTPSSNLNLKPNDLDIFFTSVSATTVSSMTAVEMEFFSNSQLIILTILMLVGGEIFISMLGIRFQASQSSSSSCPTYQKELELMELGSVSGRLDHEKEESIKRNAAKFLGYVVLGYLVVVHTIGSSLVAAYVALVPSASEVLASKSLQIQTFSVFTTVSTFSNCGFLPTNENMMVFLKNSGLQLILIPQILLGNTLYPVCLRLVIWVLEKITKRPEFAYILKNSSDLGYYHLLPTAYLSLLLAGTVFGFTLIQFVLFCCLEWSSEAMDGLNPYQKVVSALFQVVNARHSGESVFDLSVISPAMLVLFIVMMYLPAYTSFLPINKRHKKFPRIEDQEPKEERESFNMQNLVLSPLSYLVIFIILICIFERENMKNDPLNFNVLNITLEVVSAYGNVGLSTGYSCKRQVRPGSCTDAWTGFVGRWNNKAKVILIIVMLYGSLKKFSFGGGKAWKLS